ncbi:hypothetical protein LUZ60_017543 [Juncus effusus]|nr:hypothetical protein LUZ60_017543 [Juncus effusus]
MIAQGLSSSFHLYNTNSNFLNLSPVDKPSLSLSPSLLLSLNMASALRAAASIFTPSYSGAPTESPSRLSFKRCPVSRPVRVSRVSSPCAKTLRKVRVPPLAASGEATEAEETTEVNVNQEEESEAELPTETESEPETDGTVPNAEENPNPNSALLQTLESFKEALITNDKSKVSEIESFLLSIEQEKNSLSSKISALELELSIERDRILRISADFDNFRKRTEKEKLNLMDNVKGEVLEGLLAVLDNFERAKTQIKVETEGEEKINASYQSIYKQFMEILRSLGVKDVETLGTPFDPLFHEAIMQEESTEYEEGIIIQEFRKGFKLGERLLRPAMVKVSAGPGPAKNDDSAPALNEDGVLPQESEEASEEAQVE